MKDLLKKYQFEFNSVQAEIQTIQTATAKASTLDGKQRYRRRELVGLIATAVWEHAIGKDGADDPADLRRELAELEVVKGDHNEIVDRSLKAMQLLEPKLMKLGCQIADIHKYTEWKETVRANRDWVTSAESSSMWKTCRNITGNQHDYDNFMAEIKTGELSSASWREVPEETELVG